LYTGETEYFIDLIGWESAIYILPKVPVFIKWSSIPMTATVFPQGTSATY
jgi:hypothetical protein